MTMVKMYLKKIETDSIKWTFLWEKRDWIETNRTKFKK